MNKLIVTIISLITLITLGAITHGITPVSAQLDSEDHLYNQGYYDAKTDCYQFHSCWNYYNSPAFSNHPQSYRDGYISIVDWYYHKDINYCDRSEYDCSNGHAGDEFYQHNDVTSNVDSPTVNSNNDNTITNTHASETTQKTTQNVVNTPTIVCKGICNIPNVQSVTSDSNSEGN